MRTYINVHKENSLFSPKSYVAKVVNFEGSKVQRKYLPLFRGFYNCNPANIKSLCSIMIDPAVLAVKWTPLSRLFLQPFKVVLPFCL